MTKKPTMPEPPKGRRWLNENEVIRKGDRYHCQVVSGNLWHLTGYVGQPANFAFTYSRAIPRKTTRK